jgi:inorganic pyrophosphatase
MDVMNYAKLPAFDSNHAVNVVVESPRGSTVKLKYDASIEAFTLSRPLAEGLAYPYDWGFVPSTCEADGDPLDAMVVWDRASFPGVVLPCRLIGVLAVEQNSKQRPGDRERNDRLIAVPVNAPRYASITSVDDLPARLREEIESFFVASTAFEQKDLTFGGWSAANAAYELLNTSVRLKSSDYVSDEVPANAADTIL